MRTKTLQYLYLQKPITTIIVICAIALLPWTCSDFYTKGEPREAAVSAAMLKSGDWTMPEVYADEFAYKPPMMHWLIATFSLPQGHVNEFTSRLPSALSEIILLAVVLVFFGRRTRFQEAFIATMLLLTGFEMHRYGMAARVDMVLTAFMVIGLMQLYRWENKLELKGLPLSIPLFFSGAVLTKGPVGLVLPLFIFFVYLLLLRKYGFLKICKTLLYAGVSSMFIPILWYVAAYKQRGDDFLNLVLAENFSRFFHLSEEKINYNLGCEEGLFYYFPVLLYGLIPWTLLFVFSLFGIKYKIPNKPITQSIKDIWYKIRSMEKIKFFCIVTVICIFVFYTVPSSKRSVYLLPMYPFLSLLLAQYLIYITEHRSNVTRIFAYVLTTLTGIVFIVALLNMMNVIDINSIANRFTSRESTLQDLSAVSESLSVNSVSIIIMLLFATALGIVIYQVRKKINIKILYATIFLTFCTNLFIDGVVMDGIKESKSARYFAEQIKADYDINDNNLYVMNELRKYRNLYAMNFYLRTTLHNFAKEQPESGFFLTTENDAPQIIERFKDSYKFEQLAISGNRQGDIRQRAVLFKVEKVRK